MVFNNYWMFKNQRKKYYINICLINCALIVSDKYNNCIEKMKIDRLGY